MYSVLIVDDERIIREGIAGGIDWAKHGFTLAGTAQNGLEALAMIEKKPPDIVITDIKMPGLDGLGLIARVKEDYPEIQFIVLSGHGEFEFAAGAMKYGVKHYVLKPCDETKIVEIMGQVAAEIAKIEANEEYIAKIKNDLRKILPRLKEQLLKDFVTGRIYGRQEWEYYRNLCGLDHEGRIRLVLAEPEGELEFEGLFALKRMAEENVGGDNMLLGTTIGRQVLLLIKSAAELEGLLETFRTVKRQFRAYYQKEVSMAISDDGEINETPALFLKTRDYLKYGFYLGKGSIITGRDVRDLGRTPKFIFDYDYLGILVYSGNMQEMRAEIDGFFAQLGKAAYEMDVTKSYCLNLFSSIIRQSPKENIGQYMRRLLEFERMHTLEAIHRFITETAVEICEINYKKNAQRYSRQVQKVVQLVEENLDREELSLKWLAKQLLYMNVDYLGRIFRREMDEKFSDYLLRMRMEKAKDLIIHGDDKIYEIAVKVGFGDNAQYFSQVFKKHTGYSPTDFKKFFTKSAAN